MYTYALGFASPLATRGQWPSFTSLSLFPLRRRRQIDKDILAAKQALCTGRTNHHHMANVVARGVSSYMYCMYARDSDGHPLPLGRGGEWWWWVGRGLMTDEEPVQVANWLGMQCAKYSPDLSPHGGGNGRLHSVLPSPCRKKRACFNSGLLYLPLPSPHHSVCHSSSSS